MLRALTFRILVSAVACGAIVGWVDTSHASDLTGNGTQPGLEYPLQNPDRCAGCHRDFSGTPTRPWSTWAGSMMAQSSRDPQFWAALDVANNDIPGVGDWCMRCHIPHGWLGGRSEPPGGSFDGCSMEGLVDRRNNDFDGVSCHLCHRMQINDEPPRGQEPYYFENAQWWIDDSDCDGQGEPCRAGPYGYDTPGEVPPPHSFKYSALHEDSQMCAQCHNVTHPVRNLRIDGRDTGIRFPIERTYREWERSAFADPSSEHFATCQNCHMPDATADPSFACIFESNNRSGDMPMHIFVGGNNWMPEVIRGEYPSLGLDRELAFTRDAAIAQLQNATATLKLAPLPGEADGPMRVRVKVTNLSGHKLPTGYHEGRRMWIHMRAIDAEGQTVWENGAYDPASGILDHDESTKIYEAKHGVWNPQTRLCETKDDQGRENFHFVLNDCFVKDNRIPPRGFSAKPDIETMPFDYSYPRTDDGLSLVHWDITDYTIPLPADVVEPVQVVATLRFQATSKEYVEFLFNQAVENEFPDDCLERTSGPLGMSRGEYMMDLWERYDRSPPVDMAADAISIRREVPVPPAVDVAAIDPERGRIDLNLNRSAAAEEFAVFWGHLDDLAAGPLPVRFSSCDVDAAFTTTLPPTPGNWYFLIGRADGAGLDVGRDGVGHPRELVGDVHGCAAPAMSEGPAHISRSAPSP